MPLSVDDAECRRKDGLFTLHGGELLHRIFAGMGFAKPHAVQVGRLIGADNNGSRMLVPDGTRFEFGQAEGCFARRFAGLSAFIHIRRNGFIGQTQSIQKLAPVAGA